MKTLRNTLLGACLALPLFSAAGHAQTIETQGRTITVPPGAVVLILPGPDAVALPTMPAAATPAGVPVMRLIAQQEAAMQHMMADMNAMFPPMPNPSTLCWRNFSTLICAKVFRRAADLRKSWPEESCGILINGIGRPGRRPFDRCLMPPIF